MRPSRINPLNPARVALLKCRGLAQSEIAKRLGLSEATVSRLLSEGGQAHDFILPPTFDWAMLTGAQKAQLQALDDIEKLSPVLTERLLSLPHDSVRLTATVIQAATDIGGPAQQHDFYVAAARAVWQLLTPVRTTRVIGVAWGETLSLLLEGARKARLPVRYPDKKQPTIIPLCGESLGLTRLNNMSSSALAQGFGEVLTSGKNEGYWSLSMIPVFLPGPKAFSSADVSAVKKLLSFSAAYTKIFGADDSDERALANQLDIVITSISRENRAFGVDTPDFVWDTLKLRQFVNLVIGDIAGVPLGRPGTTTKSLNALQRLWTGLQADHLRLCAQRASRGPNSPAGVIVVGRGRERVACVIEAVRRGLINHLIVDEELGRALIDRLK